MSHTPGPWSVLTLDDGTQWIEAGCVRVAIMDDSAGCQPGNAALIAAAPEMLAVLEELRDSASYWSEYDVPVGIVERIESAIRKARGEE